MNELLQAKTFARLGLALIALCGFAALASCHDSHGASARDSNTNWLVLCEDDGDCTGEAQCLCGACTRACARASDCEAVADGAECLSVDAPALADRCEDLTGAVCWRGASPRASDAAVDGASELSEDGATMSTLDGAILSTLDGAPDDAASTDLDATLEDAAVDLDASADGDSGRTIPEPDSGPDADMPMSCPLCLNASEGMCGRRLQCVCPEGVFGTDCAMIHPVRQVVAGTRHTCALLAPSRVKCWGANDAGQLGLGDRESRGDQPDEMGADLPEVDFGTDTFIDKLAAGSSHTCALFVDRTVRCWGNNGAGQLGRGDTLAYGDDAGEMGAALEPVLGGELHATDIAAGFDHSCALLSSRQIACWGGNRFGQLGRGDTSARGDSPDELVLSEWIVDLGSFEPNALTAGGSFTCGVQSSVAKCWGDNSRGQLAQGDIRARGDEPGEMGDALPTAELGSFPSGFRRLVGGGMFGCALLSDSARCWGANEAGQLLLGITDNRGDGPDEIGANMATAVLDRSPTFLAAGFRHACALLAAPGGGTSELACWGSNNAGELGLGDVEARGDGPLELGANLPRVSIGASVTSVAASMHTCAVLDHDSIVCWGPNESGQLGRGRTDAYGDDPGELPSALSPIRL